MNKIIIENYSFSKDDENIRKDTHNMSFVGLSICKDGIVGFSDSKSTRFDELGNAVEDIRDIPVQKLFKTDMYILATCGSNQLLLNGILINLEDWINENIIYYNNPLDMLSELFTQLISNNSANLYTYKFFIGMKNRNRYYVQEVNIIDGQFLLSNKIYQTTRFNNAAFYATHAKDWGFDHLSTKEGIVQIEEKFKWLIESADKIGSYNPVGLPVVIKEFK